MTDRFLINLPAPFVIVLQDGSGHWLIRAFIGTLIQTNGPYEQYRVETIFFANSDQRRDLDMQPIVEVRDCAILASQRIAE